MNNDKMIIISGALMFLGMALGVFLQLPAAATVVMMGVPALVGVGYMLHEEWQRGERFLPILLAASLVVLGGMILLL